MNFLYWDESVRAVFAIENGAEVPLIRGVVNIHPPVSYEGGWFDNSLEAPIFQESPFVTGEFFSIVPLLRFTKGRLKVFAPTGEVIDVFTPVTTIIKSRLLLGNQSPGCYEFSSRERDIFNAQVEMGVVTVLPVLQPILWHFLGYPVVMMDSTPLEIEEPILLGDLRDLLGPLPNEDGAVRYTSEGGWVQKPSQN